MTSAGPKSRDNAYQFGFVDGDVKPAVPDKRGAGAKGTKRQTVPFDQPRTSVKKSLDLSSGTRVEKVTVHIGAKPPGWTKVADVAEVRAAPSGMTFDFGRMRTVAGLKIKSLTAAYPWLGAAFSPTTLGPEVGPLPPTLQFGEVLTERMMVITGATEAEVKNGSVLLPGAPSDVEVVVGGQRIWFQGGELKRGAIGITADSDDYFVAEIDATEAVKNAAAAGEDVEVELRSATSGLLSMTVKTTQTRVHDVVFPEGVERVVVFAAEGEATLDVPLPDGANNWHVAEVAFNATAKLDGRRVVPAIGPAASPDALLLLDSDHPIALQIQGEQLAPFGSLAGVRLSIGAENGSAEIGAAVLADANGEPGDPVQGGDLAPLQLEPAARAWQTMSLRRPLPLRGGPLWIALQVSRGRLALTLGASGGNVRRGRPGGPWRGFSTGVAITPKAALRVIGEPGEGPPLYALAATLPGAPKVLSIPTSEGTQVQIAAGSPVTPSGGALHIALTATAPGNYRFSAVQVFYRLAGDEAA